MSDIDLQIALMESGRMNLMHLPPGAIAWLWDRPTKQIDAAESLAVAANAYGNPVVDASLLKADQNVLIIKCEGGECFRVYPDGGFSCNDVPMDIGGCSSVLQGTEQSECPMDDLGHQVAESDGEDFPDLEYEKGMDRARDIEAEMRRDDEMDDDGFDWWRDMNRGKNRNEDIGNDEHMDYKKPESGVASPQGMTNLAGEPTMDEAKKEKGDPCWKGYKQYGTKKKNGKAVPNCVPNESLGTGMGTTGSPYVGDMAMDADPELENLVTSRELGEASIHMFRNENEDSLAYLAEALGLNEVFDSFGNEYTAADAAADEASEAQNIKLEVYDDSTDSYQDVPVEVVWDVQPTEYDGQYVSHQGGAYADELHLEKPIRVNGRVYKEIDEELARLILLTYNIEGESRSYVGELLDYITDKYSGKITVPQHRYPDSTR